MDPMGGSNIAAIIADARQSARPSLRNPSRPFTPADSGRHLFVGQDYSGSSRPSSTYGASSDALLSGHPALTSQGSSRNLLLRRTNSGRSGRPPMAPGSLDLDASLFAAASAAPLPSPLSGPHTPKARDTDGAATFQSPNKTRRAARMTEADSRGSKEPEKRVVEADEGLVTAAAALDSAALSASVVVQKLGACGEDDDAKLEELCEMALSASSELSSALECAYAVKPTSQTGKNVMANSLTNALTARRRLLRLAIRRMDKASPAVLLPLGRVALSLASAPGPLTATATSAQRPASAKSSDALHGALLHIARLLFVASKVQGNDQAFRDHGVLAAILGTITPTASGSGSGSEDAKEVEGIDRSLPIVSFLKRSPEDLIYSIGVLKNTSNLPDNQRWLVQQGAVSTLVAVIRGCLEAVARGRRGSGDKTAGSAADTPRKSSSRQLAQLLVQVTGCLRNLALTKRHMKPFWLADAVPALLALMGPFKLHSELMLNVARILSKMSLHEACRKHFSRNVNNMKRLTKLLRMHSRNPLLLIRVLFVMGNITSGNNANRHRLAMDCQAVPPLLHLLDHYGSQYPRLLAAEKRAASRGARADVEAESGAGDSGATGAGAGAGAGSDGESAAATPEEVQAQRREVEELLVKLARVLANLAINADVGSRLAVTPGMEQLVDLLEGSDLAFGEELVLNLVSAITNLSFYGPVDGDAEAPVPFSSEAVELSSFGVASIMYLHRERITRQLVPLLCHDNEEAAVESARAFGNFSRDPSVRALMISLRAVDALVILLDHTNRELVFTSCGVLMNVVSDETGKQLLRRNDLDGIGKLVELLHRCWEDDPEVAGLAAKTLFNFLMHWQGDTSVSQKPRFTAEQCVNLLEVLEDVISAAEEDLAEAAEHSNEGEGKDAQPHPHLDVARQLRTAVRELVQTGAVAMSSPSAGSHAEPGRGDSDLVPLDDHSDSHK